jgi:ribosome biogenesis protein Nip4
MKPVLVDMIEWEHIAHQLDGDFGEGVTRALMGDAIPVSIDRGNEKSLYLIPREWVSIIEKLDDNIDVKSLGFWVGNLSGGYLKLSLPAVEVVLPHTLNVLMVAKQAAESFTYGRSILKESVLYMDESLQRGQPVIVVNEANQSLGLASLTVDARMVNKLGKEKLVAKNIIDIGWFVRKMG